MWSIFLALSHIIRCCSAHTHTIPILLIVFKPFFCTRHGLLIPRSRNNILMQLYECYVCKGKLKGRNALLPGKAECFRQHFMFTFGMSLLISIFGVAFCLNRSMCKLICAKGTITLQSMLTVCTEFGCEKL